MESVLWNLMGTEKVAMDKMRLTTNNLANTNTPGFKADLHTAQTMFLNDGKEGGESWVVEGVNGIDFTEGQITPTGRDLDVAVQGKGWFVVQDSSGKEAYTRAGGFKIDADGILTTSNGLPVIGDGGPISIPPAQRIEIGTDGTISIVPMGAQPNELAVLDRLKLVDPKNKDLVKGNDGLVRLKKGGVVETSMEVFVVKGALEASNIDAVSEMVNMINAGREFDMQTKSMQMVDEIEERRAQLLRN